MHEAPLRPSVPRYPKAADLRWLGSCDFCLYCHRVFLEAFAARLSTYQSISGGANGAQASGPLCFSQRSFFIGKASQMTNSIPIASRSFCASKDGVTPSKRHLSHMASAGPSIAGPTSRNMAVVYFPRLNLGAVVVMGASQIHESWLTSPNVIYPDLQTL